MLGAEEIVERWQAQGGPTLGGREWSIVRSIVGAYNADHADLLGKMFNTAEAIEQQSLLVDEKRIAALILFTRIQCDRVLARENPAFLFRAEMERR